MVVAALIALFAFGLGPTTRAQSDPTNVPATDTPTSVPTDTPTPAPTDPPTPIPTDTPVPTSTYTPVPPPTDTPVPTSTSTATATATNTPVPPTSTATNTNTPTSTATKTPTKTATSTSTPAGCVPTTKSFVATQDAFVNSVAPDTNSGTSAELRAKSGQYESYLLFNVTGLNGYVSQATLTITSANYSGSDTVSAPDIKTVTGAWTETTITWNNRPTAGGIVASGGTVWAINAPYTWNVTSAVGISGPVSLMMAPNNIDGVNANSREQLTGKPTLSVTTSCSPVGTPTPTFTPTNTATATFIPTATNTAIATSTSTATATPTSTNTPTATNTAASTDTPTATATLTPSSTSTASSTPTPIPTSTSTPSPTSTSTSTPTATSTSTPTSIAQTPTPTGTTVNCSVVSTSFVASADAYVNQASPTTNSGTSAELRAKLATGQSTESYLTFNVTGLSGPVVQAILQLTTANYAGADTASAPDIRIVTSAWSESTVTWNTKPTYSGVLAAGGGAWAYNTMRSYDVTAAVSGNGAFSLAMTGNVSDQVNVNSREQSSGKPTLVVSVCAPPTPTPTPTNTPAPGDVVIVAAGDIACGAGTPATSTKCQQMATSNVAIAANPDAVIALGDNQYECGTLSDFQGAYDPSWGRLKSITHPVIGNHEYNISGGTDAACPGTPAPSDASGYFNYFGVAADPAYPGCLPNCKGYYSFDLGSWHIIVLNAMLCGSAFGGSQCYQGSAQEKWLVNDLKTHSNQCTLATFHEALYSTSEREPGVQQFWADLYAYGADVVLNGHLHRYERWAPQDSNGNRDDAYGLREFIVGTGGRSFQSIASAPANLQVADDHTFGVLKMTLHTNGYDWQFLPAAGGTFTDGGSASCHGKPGGATSVAPSFTQRVGSSAQLDDAIGGSLAFIGGLTIVGAGRTRRRRWFDLGDRDGSSRGRWLRAVRRRRRPRDKMRIRL